MAVLLLGLVRAFDQYPAPASARWLLTGAGFGLSIGSRIMGGFGVIERARCAGAARHDRRAAGWRTTSRRHGWDNSSSGCCPALSCCLGGDGTGLALGRRPTPLNPFHAIDYFSRFFEEPWQELFGGALIRVTDMPRSYVPTLLALQLPELFLLLGTGGAVGALIAAMRQRSCTQPPRSARC